VEIAEQHRGRAVASIPLRTIRDFHEQSHALGLYCPACECWSVANLPFLIQCGSGELSVTVARFRWRDCGGTAEKQVRLPAPKVGGAVSYI
jgi:hypothetical protein